MRNLWTIGWLGLLGAASAGGCKWTDFDDLEKDTWVSSTEKPTGDSTDYGVAVQRGTRISPSGGKLVVIGAGQAQFTELVYSSNGDAELAPTVLQLSQFGVSTLDPQPILLADPASDNVALIATAGGDQVAAYIGAGALEPIQVVGPSAIDAASYMLPPGRADLPEVEQPAQPLLAAGDSVYGAFSSTTPHPKCKLSDGVNSSLAIRGLGGAKITSTTTDDVVVWTAAGDLLLYRGDVFNGPAPTGSSCPDAMMGEPPLVGSLPADTGFNPGKGSQIVMVDDRHALLVGHKELGNSDSFLALYDVTAMSVDMPGSRQPQQIGAPITIPNLRTATILDLGTQRYVIAGYPAAVADAVETGQVLAFALDLTTGLDPTIALTLHDAQPESGQQFGRAVTVTPFNGKPVIAVAADNEIFLYFRTALYDETRLGL